MANKENIEAWLVALRSGDYKQGKGRLRIGDEFCCLGVACDLAEKAGLITSVKVPGTVNLDIYEYRGDTALLPPIVMEWLGVPNANPLLSSGDNVANLNDDRVPFAVIADLIEKTYLE